MMKDKSFCYCARAVLHLPFTERRSGSAERSQNEESGSAELSRPNSRDAKGHGGRSASVLLYLEDFNEIGFRGLKFHEISFQLKFHRAATALL